MYIYELSYSIFTKYLKGLEWSFMNFILQMDESFCIVWHYSTLSQFKLRQKTVLAKQFETFCLLSFKKRNGSLEVQPEKYFIRFEMNSSLRVRSGDKVIGLKCNFKRIFPHLLSHSIQVHSNCLQYQIASIRRNSSFWLDRLKLPLPKRLQMCSACIFRCRLVKFTLTDWLTRLRFLKI